MNYGSIESAKNTCLTGGTCLKILLAQFPVEPTNNYVQAILFDPSYDHFSNFETPAPNKVSWLPRHHGYPGIMAIMTILKSYFSARILTQNAYFSARIDSEIIFFSHNCPYRNHM